VRKLVGLSITALSLGIVSLFFEQSESTARWVGLFTNLMDYAVLALTLLEVALELRKAPVKRNYIRQNLPSLIFVVAFVALFIYNRTATADSSSRYGYLTVLIVRNLFLLLKVFTRLRKLSEFIGSVVSHPAQTIVLSFVLVIAVGTLVLMMPFTTVDRLGLPFVDALFTTTSAVCVTGLIVVDTATAFTVWGQIVIAVLIQVGGLGIMILSFFAIFVFRQSVSVESKLLISYLLSENNMRTLSSALRRIIIITVAIEFAGALFLFLAFRSSAGGAGRAVLLAVFHSVSAFCNAGFALFSNSLEDFVSRADVNFTIAALIILGGLSFGVISNAARVIGDRARRLMGRKERHAQLTVNGRAVLIVSGVLTVGGMLLFYALEHGRSMAHLPVGTQYLAAFFQSVTLRTAGFNTLPLGGLMTATYLVMIAWMFIGGASGSTAGGIKVNTVAVIGSYVVRLRRGTRQTVLFRHTVRESQVAGAFTVLLFGVLAVGIGTFLLAITESFDFTEIFFETVSAFGTVGLSTGITGGLSTPGRFVVIALMFMGRVGPLTIFSAFSGRVEPARVAYPTADISVG
jgi:trk system potassium uptake protein TrkH